MKIVIVGPTGVGKTKMSVEIAKNLEADVINADAVQIYKELNIGSAKIKEEEKEGVNHLLFDIKNPNQEYSVKDYQSDVRKIIDNSDKNYVFVGGTGLYVCAALMNYVFFEDEEEIDYSTYSMEELRSLVDKKDENNNIDKNNRQRMERFLKRKNVDVPANLLYDDVIFIGLTTNRDKLYEIINNRVDKMINDGLVDEVKELIQKYPDSKIIKRAIGYKEIVMYLNNEISLEDAIDLIKKNSRHYAKRQYTWFNNKMNINWFSVNYENFDETILEVKNFIKGCHKS